MRFAKTLVFVLAVLGVFGFSVASAQTGYIAVYFDNGFSQESGNCPGNGIPDSLYIAAVNWNMYVNGVQFKVNYPSAISYLADFGTQPVTAGNTDIGLAMGWALPQNGYQPVFVCGVTFFWQCLGGCGAVPDQLIEVVGHPYLGGTVSATRWPDNALLNGVGLTALVCPVTVPTEETTWGQVKSLYR